MELQGPDELGWVVERQHHDTPLSPIGYRYRTATGAEAFPSARFDAAEPFWNGRAFVRQGARCGLLNRRGEWVTTAPYERMLLLNNVEPDRNENDTGGEWRPEAFKSKFDEDLRITRLSGNPLAELKRRQRLDTTLMLAWRGGRVGLISRRTGREVVPAHYDKLRNYGDSGFLYFVDGQEVGLIDTLGRERWRAANAAKLRFHGGAFVYGGGPIYAARLADCPARQHVVSTR